jgi:hypothetical protein
MAHLAHLAIEFFDETVTAFEAVWTYDLGEQTLTPDADFTFQGVVQPATDATLEALPELQRSREPLTLHTRQHLTVADNDTKKQTYIKWQGHDYKAIAFGNWSKRSFYRYGLERVESIQTAGNTER